MFALQFAVAKAEAKLTFPPLTKTNLEALWPSVLQTEKV